MIKSVSIYSLPKGTDPEEFWKYHTEVHARDVARLAGKGLKKYVINRVTEVRFGEPKFWGMIEMWWESEEAKDAYFKIANVTKTPSGRSIPDDFKVRVTDQFGAQVEEKEIPVKK